MINIVKYFYNLNISLCWFEPATFPLPPHIFNHYTVLRCNFMDILLCYTVILVPLLLLTVSMALSIELEVK